MRDGTRTEMLGRSSTKWRRGERVRAEGIPSCSSWNCRGRSSYFFSSFLSRLVSFLLFSSLIYLFSVNHKRTKREKNHRHKIRSKYDSFTRYFFPSWPFRNQIFLYFSSFVSIKNVTGLWSCRFLFLFLFLFEIVLFFGLICLSHALVSVRCSHTSSHAFTHPLT